MATSNTEFGCVVLATILPTWTGFLRDKLCFGLKFQVMLQLWQHNSELLYRNILLVNLHGRRSILSCFFLIISVDLRFHSDNSFFCIQKTKKLNKRELMKHMWRKKAAERQISLHWKQQVATANISQHTLMHTYICRLKDSIQFPGP